MNRIDVTRLGTLIDGEVTTPRMQDEEEGEEEGSEEMTGESEDVGLDEEEAFGGDEDFDFGEIEEGFEEGPEVE
jgi:hypothetical protein